MTYLLKRRTAWGLFLWGHLAIFGLVSPAVYAGQQLNVLFIVVDDLNNDLGAYGHPLVQSPNIDALASRGVKFEHAYAQAPLCTPSRESFMTGLYPEQNGVVGHGDHFRDRANFREHVPGAISLPQLFRINGYFTARVGKIYHQGVPRGIGKPGPDDPLSWNKTIDPRGIDKDVEQQIVSIGKNKKRPSFGSTLSWLKLDGKGEDHTDGKVASETIRLLRDHHPENTGKPFFIGVGFYRPHTPFVAPSEYFDLYRTQDINLAREPKNDRKDIPPAALKDKAEHLDLTTDKKKEIIQAYYAAVSFMDAQVGRVLDELERLGLADSTIVVFLSDHGYHLGNHGGLWQKHSLFEDAARVPLIIASPGRINNASASGPVELVDLYPTLAELTGLDAPDYLSGKSLAPMLDDPSHVVRKAAFTMMRSQAGSLNPAFRYKDIRGYSIRTERYRYTEWGGGNWGIEMYDHDNDPGEYRNLGDKQPVEHIRMYLKRLLEDRRRDAAFRIRHLETSVGIPE